MKIADDYRLVSPEKVNLNFRLAGVGSRIAACFIDTLFQSLIMLSVIVFLMLFGIAWTGMLHLMGVKIPKADQAFGLVILAGFLLLSTVVYSGYFILFETVWNGQTPGKRLLKLRVVQENGLSLTFLMVLIRNLLRVIDALPVGYAIGILAVLISKRNQRLGDLAAGTIVARDSMESAPQIVDFEVVETAWTGTVRLSIHKLSENDFAILKNYLLRRPRLKKEEALGLERKLATFFCDKLGVNLSQVENYPEFLKQVAAMYQHR